VARQARGVTTGLRVTGRADVARTSASRLVSLRRATVGPLPIEVPIVAALIQLSKDGTVIQVHPIRHDRTR
jgi:hypothetical protein